MSGVILAVWTEILPQRSRTVLVMRPGSMASCPRAMCCCTVEDVFFGAWNETLYSVERTWATSPGEQSPVAVPTKQGRAGFSHSAATAESLELQPHRFGSRDLNTGAAAHFPPWGSSFGLEERNKTTINERFCLPLWKNVSGDFWALFSSPTSSNPAL